MKQIRYDEEQGFVDAPVRAAQGAAIAVGTRPGHYARRMVVFLVVIGIIAVLLHQQMASFFLRNPPLNTLIVSILVIGIALSFQAVLSLEPEVSWIQRFRRGDPALLVEPPPPLLGPLALMLRDPKTHFRLSVTGMRSILDGVESRLDERRDTSRYLIALLIFLGLLGTFWGLLMTANSVGETIRGLNVSDSDAARMFETLRAGLEAPLSGMGTAFSSSLFGLASSLVLGFLDLQASQAQNRFAIELEGWLTSLTGPEGAAAADAGSPAPSYVSALLEQTAENIDALQARVARAVDESSGVNAALRALGDRLASLTDELRARDGIAGAGVNTQVETRALLERIAGAVESLTGGLDGRMRAHLENLDASLGRLIEEGARGRDHAVTEIRNEIRLLARTLSVIADRER
jgi:hypothetical protein